MWFCNLWKYDSWKRNDKRRFPLFVRTLQRRTQQNVLRGNFGDFQTCSYWWSRVKFLANFLLEVFNRSCSLRATKIHGRHFTSWRFADLPWPIQLKTSLRTWVTARARYRYNHSLRLESVKWQLWCWHCNSDDGTSNQVFSLRQTCLLSNRKW